MKYHVPVQPGLAGQLVREYEAGATMLQLARQHHIGFARMRRVLWAVLRQRGKRPVPLAPEVARAIAAEYQAGATIAELKERHRVGELKIELALADNDIEKRRCGARRRQDAPAIVGSSETLLCVWLVGAAVLAALTIMAFCTPSYAHDWYAGLRNAQGEQCCGGQDCAPYDYRRSEGGLAYEALMPDGSWLPIPRETILPMGPEDLPEKIHVCCLHNFCRSSDNTVVCTIVPGFGA